MRAAAHGVRYGGIASACRSLPPPADPCRSLPPSCRSPLPPQTPTPTVIVTVGGPVGSMGDLKARELHFAPCGRQQLMELRGQLNEHIEHNDGPLVFEHACRILIGLV